MKFQEVKVGDKVIYKNAPELGIGIVTRLDILKYVIVKWEDGRCLAYSTKNIKVITSKLDKALE